VVVVIVGKKFWDQLSGDEKKIMQDSCVEARDYERKVNREMGPKALAELKAKGMAFNELAPDELAKFRASVKPVVDKHAKAVSADLVTQAYAAIEAARKRK
jgi:TRAP-type C4-dicarboxylate transport system substrate-binding protein